MNFSGAQGSAYHELAKDFRDNLCHKLLIYTREESAKPTWMSQSSFKPKRINRYIYISTVQRIYSNMYNNIVEKKGQSFILAEERYFFL